jgi:hypothetical protein
VAPVRVLAVAIWIFFMASSCMRLLRVSRTAERVLYTDAPRAAFQTTGSSLSAASV